MRPHDLKPPFAWDRREILVKDRVWYVPIRYQQEEKFVFPGWDHPDLFGNQNPVVVEFCSGNGDWIAAKAKQHPHLNWVAVEKKFERVRKIWSKIKNLQLNNLIALCGEGFNATKLFFPSKCVEDIFINFPDPWPKTRHFKHRIIQPEFVNEMWRAMKVGAQLTFVTDDEEYSHWFIRELLSHQGFKTSFIEPYYQTSLDQYGTSYFDQLWREQGKVIRYHQFIKHEASI